MLVPLAIYVELCVPTQLYTTIWHTFCQIGENKTTNAYLRYLVSFPYLLINLRTVLGEREISGLYSERDEREKGKSGINCCFLASGDNFMAGELNVLTAPKINGHQNGKGVEAEIQNGHEKIYSPTRSLGVMEDSLKCIVSQAYSAVLDNFPGIVDFELSIVK